MRKSLTFLLGFLFLVLFSVFLALLPSLSVIFALLMIICFASIHTLAGVCLWFASSIIFLYLLFFTTPSHERSLSLFYGLSSILFFILYLLPRTTEEKKNLILLWSVIIAIFNFVFSLFSLPYIGGPIGAFIALISCKFLETRKEKH